MASKLWALKGFTDPPQLTHSRPGRWSKHERNNRNMTPLAQRKISSAVRLARQSSRDSWQHANSPKQAREYRRIARASIADARTWLDVTA